LHRLDFRSRLVAVFDLDIRHRRILRTVVSVQIDLAVEVCLAVFQAVLIHHHKTLMLNLVYQDISMPDKSFFLDFLFQILRRI
jgi:ABC-type uncharacterized transport system auxiliary subunit